MGNIITDKPKDKVILLPKTIDFYQIELTRMLETERYKETVKLLQFLCECDSGDPQIDKEWASLLDWLEHTDINTGATIREAEGPEINELDDNEGEAVLEETESDLIRQQVKVKTETDREYAGKMLHLLQHSTHPEKQMLALDQLTYMEHPDIDISVSLQQWVEKTRLSPWIQFKTLQALRMRGVIGQITIPKQDAIILIDIERVPLVLDEYPPTVLEILQRVQRVCEAKDPSLAIFAEQTWELFLIYIYGTPAYTRLLELDDTLIDVWAAALHFSLSEALAGVGDEVEIHEFYGITSELKLPMKQTQQIIENFMQTMRPIL